MRFTTTPLTTSQRLAWAAGGMALAYVVARAYRQWADGGRALSVPDADLPDDAALDDVITDSFPASDPPSWTSTGAVTQS